MTGCKPIVAQFDKGVLTNANADVNDVRNVEALHQVNDDWSSYGNNTTKLTSCPKVIELIIDLQTTSIEIKLPMKTVNGFGELYLDMHFPIALVGILEVEILNWQTKMLNQAKNMKVCYEKNVSKLLSKLKWQCKRSR